MCRARLWKDLWLRLWKTETISKRQCVNTESMCNVELQDMKK